ncbi:MAG TPA: hypothetical protein VN323_20265 [Candidatus Dormibacteraeota bacterium]|jgi:hypothetical protein|nr:hypothetical protein [Candidatus Dormibacteraeota bacterium]
MEMLEQHLVGLGVLAVTLGVGLGLVVERWRRRREGGADPARHD